MSKIENLKMVIFSEWSNDPPAGCVTFHSIAWGESYEEFMELVDVTYENLSESVFGNEKNELNLLYREKRPDPNYIKGFYWSNGGCGGGCAALAEGKNIVDSAIDYFMNEIYDTLDLYGEEEYEIDYEDEYDEYHEEDDEEGDEAEEEEGCEFDEGTKGWRINRIMEKAEAEPENYDAVIELLKMIDLEFSNYNDSMF